MHTHSPRQNKFHLVSASSAAFQPEVKTRSLVQRKLAPGARETFIPSQITDVLESPGQPLDPSTRERMETQFGHDFSRVRIHQDEKAGASADTLGALAYTAGSDLVFARGQYSPGRPQGAHLLAHELAHVVQQSDARHGPLALSGPDTAFEREADTAAQQAGIMDAVHARPPALGAAPFSIQRQPVTGTLSSIPLYELGGNPASPVQTLTGQQSAGRAVLRLSYDSGTGNFFVTFPLVWIFTHGWDNTRRNNYVTEFMAAVRRVWNDKFELNDSSRPPRTAHVQLNFDNDVILQMASQAEENAELSTRANDRWIMDVRNLSVREEVNRATSVVSLGDTSNQPQTRNAAALRRMAPFSFSGTGGSSNFTQAASPHEFGHMIGLGDEYLEDVTGASVPSAVRGNINNRIMNVGENVTADAYAPFANWLSTLTSTTWRVGRRI